MRAPTLLLALAACNHASAPAGSGHEPAGGISDPAGFNDPERATVQQAITQAQQTVRSSAFHEVLAQIPTLHVSAHGVSLIGRAVDDAYAGRGTGTTLPVRYEPAGLWRRISAHGETAITGIESGKHPFAITRLHSIVLDRYAAVPEGRACVINTLAHEWTHAITHDGNQVFTDDGYETLTSPIVSYTVGAVAQCIYLQRWRPMLDVPACIQAAGTHGFQICTCAAGWLDAFIAGGTSCKQTDQ